MKKHEHQDCAHVMKFCAPCNEAYCGRCDAVWAMGPCTLSHYLWTYSTPTITGPYWTGTEPWTTTTWDGACGSSSTDTVTISAHSACENATS